ncbi:MAG: fatty acid desaturase, partial [Nannocystaceae bacterium]
WTVLGMFFYVSFVQGVVLSVVFQLAHCVTETEFPTPAATDGTLQTDWAVHQLQTTADFAPHNRFLGWYVGGLNFQVVHHLFPKVSHTHYPAISRIVADTAVEFGLQYHCVPSLREALRSHYRHLRGLGAPAGA